MIEPRKKKEFNEKIKKELMSILGIDNVMAVPMLTKIVINTGMGEAKEDTKQYEEMANELAAISGQKPVISKAKKAISNFKIRAGSIVGLSVTLRGRRMWEFFDKLVSITLPRVKDFRGLSPKSFDGRGNYSLGLKEHTVFIEVDTNKVTKLRGVQITLCTSSGDDKRAYVLLEKLGMPFMKNTKKQEEMKQAIDAVEAGPTVDKEIRESKEVEGVQGNNDNL
ncbi:50S ribosomal protein L5 [Candidatus Dojkabacteria bacterium]|nr:50S ribosomal protein L5 [Candidatus Dojkabacteria bacterium]